MKKINILLLHADGTQALPFAESLAHLGCRVSGVFLSRFCYGYASRYIKQRFLCPCDMRNLSAYYNFLSDILTKHHFDIIIPLNDESAELLSKYKKQLSPLAKFIIPNYDVFTKGYDKESLMQICKDYHFPHPQTYQVKSGKPVIENSENLPFPLIIKPNITCGARGMKKVNSLEELEICLPETIKQYGACHIQRYVPQHGKQFEAQLFLDENLQLKYSSILCKHRWYPVHGGSSSCNESFSHDEIIHTLHRLLQHIGWVGFADFDLIEDPLTGELLIMELNPRMPACIKTPIAAGTNWPEIMLREHLHLPEKTYPAPRKIYLRHIGFEILWFLSSKNRWKTYPNWFRFIGKHIYFQDLNWRDPFPFLLGNLANIFKLFNPSFRKSKSGTNP